MKDAYYFSHDSNARNDQKILAVRMKYGIKGYGIYFGIIEMLRESKGYELFNDWSTIAYDLREPQADIEDIVKNYELFIVNDVRFYSESLMRRMEELDERRAIRSKAGRIGGLASASKRQAIVDDSSSSKPNQSKVKESNKNQGEKPGFLNEKVEQTLLKDISLKNGVSPSSESATLRLGEIVKEVAATKDVKNPVGLARHKARNQ